MRHIILDTETTGLSVREGHRIIEIGALEMVNYALTGEKLHLYINPEREIDEGAQAIHGISAEFLQDKPVFSEIADKFLTFVGEDVLVIHNAPFDVGFLNAELENCQKPVLSKDRVTDTLTLARQKFPGAQASLDALCRRFQIDNSHRDLHGALIDADLLAGVFVELQGGKQPGLALQEETEIGANADQPSMDEGCNLSGFNIAERPIRPARIFAVPTQELTAHNALLDKMDNPIWRQTASHHDKETD
ncbi:DNA polymerase III subunit epsilon [Alphaproteobacteria bacterium]|nr:DNA polymerase III subunit epsilon [Alphaproteobacteria bacterium]